MVISFCRILKKEKVSFAVEVPFYERSIDLVYIDPSKNFHALEFKINDWRKAVLQARYCASGADFVYICLPQKKYNSRIEKEVELAGCGLVLFDTKTKGIKIAKKQKRSSSHWDGAASLLKEGFDYSIRNKNYQQLLAI